MTRRRLLLTVDAVGGVWQYTLELAAALRPRGWDTVLALLGPAASRNQRAAAVAAGARLVDTGLALDWLAPDAAAVAAVGAAVAALARAERVELVQLNQPALAAGFAADVPLVVAVHSCVATWWDAVRGGALPGNLAWQADLTGKGLAAADAVVAPSAAFAAAITARYGVAAQVIHNGRTAPPAMPSSLHDFAFTAGRLWDAGKDIATLDRAAARLAVPFKAAGPLRGPHGESVATKHLHAVGRLDEPALAACLASAPVFVSAARYEPFGLAVLEAALAGCALVLSDIATFRELWEGVATFVAPGDDPGFAAAVEGAIGDSNARLAAGERARARAARYTAAAMAGGMDATYRRLLGNGTRVAA